MVCVLCSKERVICESCKHVQVVMHACKVNVGCSLVPRPLPDFILHSCKIKSGSGLGTRLCGMRAVVCTKYSSTMGRANSSRRIMQGGRSQNFWSNISDMQNIHSTNENKDYLLPASAWKITLPNFWLNAPIIITGWKWRNANIITGWKWRNANKHHH